jgi:SnoaL-like domain
MITMRVLLGLLLFASDLSAGAVTANGDTAKDRLLINESMVAFANAHDETDMPRFKALFTPDAQIALPDGKVIMDGAEKVASAFGADQKRLNPNLAPGTLGILRHFLTNCAVEVKGERASSSCYALVTAFNAKDKKPEIEAVGRYLFEYSRVHDTWLIKRVTMVFDQGNDEVSKVLGLGPYHP